MTEKFFNRNGEAIAYTDKEDIYLYSGKVVAYMDGDEVYAYSGKHIGWFEEGWIRDLNGNCVFFTENAVGGLAKPATHATPAKNAQHATPAKGKHASHAKSAYSNSWSENSGKEFFGL